MIRQLIDAIKEKVNLSEEQLPAVMKILEEKDENPFDLLMQKNILSETQLLTALCKRYRIPFRPNLPLEHIRSDFTENIPIQFLKKYVMVPILSEEPLSGADTDTPVKDGAGLKTRKKCLIAINNPSAFSAMDDLARILGVDDYQVVFSLRNEILSAIGMAYDFNRDTTEQLVQDMEDSDETLIGAMEDTADLLADTSDAPVIRLVNNIISQAIKARSSDIHMEPYQNSLKIRYRVDGILYDLVTPPKGIQPALISRIKVMAKLNIAEKRLPQDGRFDVRIGEQEIDVRVSTLPTSFGERVVLRLLNKASSFFKVTELGLEADQFEQVQKLITSPNGIILVTGPTGSGKTTTLYAILASINRPDINIITIEDPVEYQLPGISQIQVNPKIDLSFARGLRSIVRQDPDVILVGEIRDHETAEIAVQSALTGHLVFSTLHTNDSASAITRLVDIGVEPFLISSAVLAVVAQRLVRLLCNNCKESYTPEESLLAGLGLTVSDMSGQTVFRSTGCEDCINTGFLGRIPIFEIMTMVPELKSLILNTHDSNLIKQTSVENGMITLPQDGIRKVLNGRTTVEEVLRVAQK
ncbi:General secretion pathway protein E [Olavius algarvensis associated proteobacterium Delta 3]|nr:General secretion pathway protein E [Olavius algarvensis associated proteobacterium Delta 3]